MKQSPILLVSWIALPLVLPVLFAAQLKQDQVEVKVNCFDSAGVHVKDRLTFHAYRDGKTLQTERPDAGSVGNEIRNGEATIRFRSGSPISLIIRGERLYVPCVIPGIAVHEGAPATTLSLALRRDTGSVAGRKIIKAAAQQATVLAPDSDVTKELEDWGNQETQAKKQIKLTPAELKTVENCLSIIRGCQLPDGAFCQKNDGRAPNSPVWIPPYFANYSVLALLAANDNKKNPDDVKRVGKWLEWCASHQSAEGYWTDFEGTIANYRSNNKVDAWDSSAGLFLLAVDRYRSSGAKTSPAIMSAAKKAVACIEAVVDEKDGLTWATPTYKVKYLMDNIESYGGLVASTRLFQASGDKEAADRTLKMARRIREQLPLYWREESNCFATAYHPNGQYDVGLEKPYPDAQAQMFGLACVEMKQGTWKAVSEKFTPDGGNLAVIGPERWLTVASRIGGNTEKEWRAKVTKTAGEFTPKNVYIFRPGLAVLALLEGADWMPNQFDPLPE